MVYSFYEIDETLEDVQKNKVERKKSYINLPYYIRRKTLLRKKITGLMGFSRG
jgi:hypothetical protein